MDLSKPQEHGMNALETFKALYGLKQAPRAWYECLRDFLIVNAFMVGKADPTLFTKTCDGDLFVCQIYVDDIIFGSTNKKSCEEFSRVMTQKFEMSMMGELNYFLGFQVKQLKDGTFISQTKYTQDLIKRFGMKDAKPAKTPMGTDGHVEGDDAEIRDVDDGRVELLPWVPSEATQGRHLHLPNKVHARLDQAVWDEGRQARKDSNGNRRTCRPQKRR